MKFKSSWLRKIILSVELEAISGRLKIFTAEGASLGNEMTSRLCLRKDNTFHENGS
jgi:hypothetical protein